MTLRQRREALGVLLLTPTETARILRLTPGQLDAARHAGNAPAHVILGARTIRYYAADVHDKAHSPAPLLLRPAEAAARLGITVAQLRRQRQEGQGPAWCEPLQGVIRYLAPDVDRHRQHAPA